MKIKKVLFLFVIICIMLLFVSSDNKSDESNIVGYIEFLSGDVSVIHSESDKEENVEIGAPVYLEDTFITGNESKLEIKLKETGSIVTIFEESNMKIETILDENNNKKTFISLIFGKIKNVVTKLKGDEEFLIQTPSGQASVRGTEFIVASSDLGETVVEVDKGAVEVSNDVSGIIVKPGNQSLVDVDKKPELLKKKLVIDSWLIERKKALKKEGIKRIIFLYKKANLFDKRLKEIEFKLNSIYKDEDFQKILKKKINKEKLTKYEEVKWKVFRKKIRVLAVPTYKAINSMHNILSIIRNIGQKIELKTDEARKIYKRAKVMIDDIKRVSKKLNILYKITGY